MVNIQELYLPIDSVEWQENVFDPFSFIRLRGYDVITVKEVSKKGFTDLEQIQYAASEKRVLFTHNIADFCKIHSGCVSKGYEHSGIIVSKQLPIGVIVKALLRLLSSVNYGKVRNNIIWLSDWMKKR